MRQSHAQTADAATAAANNHNKIRTAKRGLSSGIATLALLAVGLAGCGSSDNGIASETPQEILAASMTAIGKASSVTIKGESARGRLRTLTIGLQLTRQVSHANLTVLGESFQITSVGGTIYVKGTPALYQHLGITRTIPTGTWVKAPAGKLAQFAAITDLTREASLIISTRDTITKGTTATIEGQPAIELKTQSKIYRGRLFIKTTGQPLPLKQEKTGHETSHIAFTNWNQTPTPTAPANTTTVTLGSG